MSVRSIELETAAEPDPAWLALSEWRARRDYHRERLSPWTRDRVRRAAKGIRHPVYDFLFEYYSFRPAHLERWSPGAEVFLEGLSPCDSDWPDDFIDLGNGSLLPAGSFPSHRLAYLGWAHRYLREIAERPASFCCFGLHEWAMIYRAPHPRHAQVPLRLSNDDIADVVESSDLRCTHYDAFRFFTPDAAPKNRFSLSRAATTDYDQRGCIHVTMDLYRFAHKIAPWCPAELTADAFLLAVEARTIDMRASPYDLAEAGFPPIRIETISGREEYIEHQRRLSESASPIRARLISVYAFLIEALARDS